MGQPLRPRRAASDVVLLHRVRAGDRGAFDELFERYFRRVRSFVARRTADPRECREVTEAVVERWFEVMTAGAEPEEQPARSALALIQLEFVRRGRGRAVEPPVQEGDRAAPRGRGPRGGRRRTG